MGRGAFGGTMCGPVFTEFMEKALEDHGSFKRPQPPGTVLVKIDRFTGQRLPNGASGGSVVAELFRSGEEPAIGGFGSYIDGGFAMGADLPLYDRSGRLVEEVNVGGQTRVLPANPSAGDLTTNGLY